MTSPADARRRRFIAAPAMAALAAATPWHAASAQETTPARLQRSLGRSGRMVPAIGMGTWLTFDVGDDALEREQRRQVLQRFFAAGGGMIDSSPMYGSAERVVGDLLPGLSHEGRLIAATKVWTPLTGLGPGQLERSLQEWRIARFDVLLVHNLLNWRAHLKLLRRAKDEGRARLIGVSTSHGSRHDDVERILRSEPIDVLQITYNLADMRAEALLALAAERGIAVVVNRPFDGGRLFDAVGGRAPPPWAAEAGCATWPALFLKWIVSNPAVSCAIPATRQPAHMDENMAAGLGALPDAATRRRMQSLVAAS